MKAFFYQVLKAAKARVHNAIMPPGRKNPAYKLNPAPAYWVLKPVHPHDLMGTKAPNNTPVEKWPHK